MMSPRSVEIKLGAEEPLKPEEAKRCELKPPMEIKRTARIHSGGRVPTGAITSRYHVKKERVSTPIRRSELIRSMKRKGYKEVSPEPKYYGVSDYSNDRSPSTWAAAGREDNNLYYWEEVPKGRLPKVLIEAVIQMMATTLAMNDPFEMHLLHCAACHHSITDLYTSVNECFQAMEAMRQRM
jgi:hypothetical protein